MQKQYADRQRTQRNVLPERSDVLEPSLAQTVCAANDAYINELAAVSLRGGAHGGLPPAILGTIGTLDRAARRRMASLPFTLFSLRFADAAYWQDLIERPAAPQRRATVGDGFGRTAVFLAWHLVQASPATAALALGMSNEVATLYRWLPLGELDRLGTLANAGTTPRWPWHAGFWERLLDAGRQTAGIDSARFHGLQLLAAESLPEAKTRLKPSRSM